MIQLYLQKYYVEPSQKQQGSPGTEEDATKTAQIALQNTMTAKRSLRKI
jgi:hypothetical protein